MNINEAADKLVALGLEVAGLPTKIDKNDLPPRATLLKMRASLDRTERAWKRYIERTPLKQIVTVGFTHNGKRITDIEGGLELDLSSRSLTVEEADEALRSMTPWLGVRSGAGGNLLYANETATAIQRRVFATWSYDYGTGLGTSTTVRSFFSSQIGQLTDRKSYIELARRAFKRDTVATEVERRDTSQNFEAFAQAKRTKLSMAPGPSISALIVPDEQMETSRTWGIEVEAAGARGVSEPYDWERKDDSSLVSAYSDSGEQYIEPSDCPIGAHDEEVEDAEGNMVENPDYRDPNYCDHCGYVSNDDEDYNYEDTAEFVSGILTEFHNDGLKTLVQELSEQPQNDSAGVHVHVGAGDLTPKQVGGLVYAYQIIEPLIEQEYYRETRTYCKRRGSSEVLNIIRNTKKAKLTGAEPNGNRYDYDNRLDYGDRYVAVNLHALGAHGTVEFRAMGPVYEYDHLIRWAYFCREMVNLAAANVKPKEWAAVNSWADVVSLFAKYGKETPEITLRALDFATEQVSA